MATADAGIAVGHVRRALLMNRGNETDAGCGKDVQGIHVGRTDDAEDVGDAVRHQGFDQGFARRHVLAPDHACCHDAFSQDDFANIIA